MSPIGLAVKAKQGFIQVQEETRAGAESIEFGLQSRELRAVLKISATLMPLKRSAQYRILHYVLAKVNDSFDGENV